MVVTAPTVYSLTLARYTQLKFQGLLAGSNFKGKLNNEKRKHELFTITCKYKCNIYERPFKNDIIYRDNILRVKQLI